MRAFGWRFQIRLRHAAVAVLFSLALCSARAFSDNQKTEFVSFAEAGEILQMFADSGLPGSDIKSPEAWERWIRAQDAEVRSRIERGVEDSISNLILYGTSFTKLPRLETPESAVTPENTLTASASARVEALAHALAMPSGNQRIQVVREYLRRKKISGEAAGKLLAANLARFAREQHAYQQELTQAENTGDVDQKNLARGTLYQTRGLSADTSLLVNYGLEDTLRAFLEKDLLSGLKIRRIAVIGPGLDFTNKHNGYDFYPLQTIQPFAVMETVLRLKLGDPDQIEVVAMDLNPAVNSHITESAKAARSGRPYTLQLPRDSAGDWPAGAFTYWERFGAVFGRSVAPLPVPEVLPGVTVRAVAVAPRYASRVTATDLNVVTQRLKEPEGSRFDLVIATNILVYYDRFQQGLATANIAAMMNHGGIFMSNDALSAHHDSSLQLLGRHSVRYASSGPYGDNILLYRLR